METNVNVFTLFDTKPKIESVLIMSVPFFLNQNSTSTAVPPCVFSNCGEKPNS